MLSQTVGSSTSMQSGNWVDDDDVVDAVVLVVTVVVVVNVVVVGISPLQARHFHGHITCAAYAIAGCVHMKTSM